MVPLSGIYAWNFMKIYSLAEENSYFKTVLWDDHENNLMEMKDSEVYSKNIQSSDSDNQDLKAWLIPEQQTLFQAYMIDPFWHIWIFVLYFFEYVIITGLFDRLAQLRNGHNSPNYIESHLFVITQFVYQFGVLLSRSSLYLFGTKRTGLITVGMCIEFLLFFYFCLYYIGVSQAVILTLAFLSGVLGGWGYLFSYYRVMDNFMMTKTNREKLISYLAVSGDGGALVATAFATFLSNTILKIE